MIDLLQLKQAKTSLSTEFEEQLHFEPGEVEEDQLMEEDDVEGPEAQQHNEPNSQYFIKIGRPLVRDKIILMY